MSTHFNGEGNIGSAPEFHEYPNGNEEPRRVLRLNVYFNNPVPGKDGTFEDRGSFWQPVDWWHRDAERFAELFQKGMRVVVSGRVERDDWTDENNNPRTTYRVNARSVGILPYRIEAIILSPKPGSADPLQPNE
ncbi:single-stranded DNA-binding protein [Dickeya dianthicola]|uniref:Single-stranded DNA-binding protein n=1 Tax=Dickeya dianthicola TaxID=204039 RepID=A0ABX9NR57_9GAMM|nr:single-stranded DNA-binding protein [Dickeya dianthicola]MCI4116633.1 single-stranded DNA-binding protein [Dickeya dianthicola]MCI4121186.1 single-stranded DNA-binding protein [Dickeya dianthicola]MCI4125439.1 single-stranded DNA-binding protein [Dickeya dianthicola]RJL72432.1 single-stranded DNA-binding protein [Dickeya dianthicola]RJL74135.1 single-stranded DNA-binding protein [Dickeya dianthicola]